MPDTAQEHYKLNGKFNYGVYISEFDGWDYKFPIVNPVRLEGLHEILKDSVPKAKSGEWLDVKMAPAQQNGYYSWVPTGDFILHMRPSTSYNDDKYGYVGRFSYEPDSKELLLGTLMQKHAETIKLHGSHSFNKYVRGIYLKDQKLILLKAYFNPLDEKGVYHDYYEFDPDLDVKKSNKTIEMLLKNNMPSDVSIITRVDNEVVKRFDRRFV